MKKAYLNVEPLSKGAFSNERFVQIKNHLGERKVGLFQTHWMKDESKLSIIVLSEDNGNALISVPHLGEYGIYNKNQDTLRTITVKSEDIIYN